MTFDEILEEVVALLQRQGCVSYRALKRRSNFDDEYLEDLKVELIKAQRLAIDEEGDVLVWRGGATSAPAPPSPQSVKEPASRDDRSPTITPSSTKLRMPGAKRRQLTDLFCDLVDSTALASTTPRGEA
jgi:hypothetical protein